MALGSHQKISRVLSGRPFGDGSDGVETVSSDNTQSPPDESCSGSSGSKDLTCGGASMTTGHVVIIHQSRGTGIGQWEINRIASGGGTVNLVMAVNLNYTYTDSGDSQAQVIKLPMYSAVTVNSGKTWTGKAWGGSVGGILLFACNGTTTVTGNITATGKGFKGWPGEAGIGKTTGRQGEGDIGAGGTVDHTANGSGAGGGYGNGGFDAQAGGGAGGHGGAGGDGGGGQTNSKGYGGGTSGVSGLTTMTFGGGGGSGARGARDQTPGNGGYGGGIVIAVSKTIAITGTVTSNGKVGTASNNYTDSDSGGAGGGAGGSVLIQSQTSTLGSGLVTTNGKNGGRGSLVGGSPSGGAGGGAGGGRIALYYSGSYTGAGTAALGAAGTPQGDLGIGSPSTAGSTGSVAYTQDGSLIETGGAFIFNIL